MAGVIYGSEYLHKQAAKTESVEPKERGAKLDEKEMKISSLSCNPLRQLLVLINQTDYHHHLLDLNKQGLTFEVKKTLFSNMKLTWILNVLSLVTISNFLRNYMVFKL